MDETNPVLYILMRDDLPSMNAGKAMAQASHASNAFVYGELKRWADHPIKTGWEKFKMFLGLSQFVDDDFLKWVNGTSQGFGTVLVLAMNERSMRSTVMVADMMGFNTDVIHDPTYPILVPPELGSTLIEMNNHSVFEVGKNRNYVTIPLDTCAYVFGDKNDSVLEVIVGHFPLHP